jgi:hypothetical protein
MQFCENISAYGKINFRKVNYVEVFLDNKLGIFASFQDFFFNGLKARSAQKCHVAVDSAETGSFKLFCRNQIMWIIAV